MTMTSARGIEHIDRQERIYRRLLFVYPRSFRDEYGDDLVQSFRDLMVFTADGRGPWLRTVRDLISSAAKEHGAMFSGGRKPSLSVVFVVVATLLAAIVMGPGLLLPVIMLPTVVMLGLPIYGIAQFRRAWLVRRTTAGAIARNVTTGVASFAPAAAVLALLSPTTPDTSSS